MDKGLTGEFYHETFVHVLTVNSFNTTPVALFSLLLFFKELLAPPLLLRTLRLIGAWDF